MLIKIHAYVSRLSLKSDRREKNKKVRKGKGAVSEGGSNIDAVQYTGRRHGRVMSLVADGERRSTGQEGKETGEDDEEEEQERGKEKEGASRRSLYSY